MPADKYWDSRAVKRLTEAEKQSEAYIKRIHKMYDRANRNIQRDIEDIYRNYSGAAGIDVQSLKALLTKAETQRLWDKLTAKGLDGYVKENYKVRISRLEKLQAEIYAKVKELYVSERSEHTLCYGDIINGGYYKAIYDAQTGTGLGFSFSGLDDNTVKAVLNEKWSGKNYSQRIWGNTDILAESVSELVGGAMLSGQGIAKTSKQIRDRFNVGKYYAERLARTEVNHFHNEADFLAYREMGVDKYVFMATLDTRTSEVCQALDNKVFELNERKTGVNFPPLHPNCRSTTRAYMGEDIEKSLKHRAQNPITGETEVIDNISYKEWAKKLGINKLAETEGLKKVKVSGIIKLNDIQIGRSVGAKAKNYDILDPQTGIYFHFAEGTKILNPKVFAGKGAAKPLNIEVAEGLSEQIGGQPQKWQHVKGMGYIDYYGEERKAEVHWFQEETVGKHKIKVKRWLDDEY